MAVIKFELGSLECSRMIQRPLQLGYIVRVRWQIMKCCGVLTWAGVDGRW